METNFDPATFKPYIALPRLSPNVIPDFRLQTPLPKIPKSATICSAPRPQGIDPCHPVYPRQPWPGAPGEPHPSGPQGGCESVDRVYVESRVNSIWIEECHIVSQLIMLVPEITQLFTHLYGSTAQAC